MKKFVFALSGLLLVASSCAFAAQQTTVTFQNNTKSTVCFITSGSEDGMVFENVAIVGPHSSATGTIPAVFPNYGVSARQDTCGGAGIPAQNNCSNFSSAKVVSNGNPKLICH